MTFIEYLRTMDIQQRQEVRK